MTSPAERHLTSIWEERERAVNIAVALEGECAKMTDLLRQACAFITSENAYDVTDFLEECVRVGIDDAYDGIPSHPESASGFCGVRSPHPAHRWIERGGGHGEPAFPVTWECGGWSEESEEESIEKEYPW